MSLRDNVKFRNGDLPKIDFRALELCVQSDGSILPREYVLVPVSTEGNGNFGERGSEGFEADFKRAG